MWAYLLLLLFMLLCIIGMFIYLLHKTKKIINNKIKNKWIYRMVLLSPILLFFIGFMIDSINSIVVYIHFFLFSLLIELILIKKKNIKPYISLAIGLILTTIWLSYGYYMAHHVVETNYTIFSKKDIGVDNFRIVQISDSHIGATMNGDDFAKYMKLVSNSNPDIVVITGDYVDDNTAYSDMIKGCEALGKIKTKYGVYFVYGNHDKGYSNYRDFNDEILRKELKKNNIIILEDEYINITDDIVLVGRQDAEVKDRLSAIKLTQDIDKNKYIIMLDHQPNDYDNEVLSKSDLVLSGHTHGGQLIPLNVMQLFIKVNDKTYGLEKRKDTTFIVNSGLGDWAIKFKTGSKSEYVVIDIRKGD